MDDFTVYGNSFEEALENLEKFLIICKETNLSLSHEKLFMMLLKVLFWDIIFQGMELKLIDQKLKSSPSYLFQIVKKMLEVFWDLLGTIEDL